MRIQFPSITEFISSITNAARRFPFVFLFALAGCIIATIYVHQPNFVNGLEKEYTKAILTCLLALPLFVAINSVNITSIISASRKWILRLLALLFLAAFYFLSPTDTIDSTKFITRFVGFNLCFHLFVAFLPYLNKKNNLQFWEYNKTLFLNFIQGVFYSVTAGIGLMLALLALDKLFGINIEEEILMTIWIWLMGFVNTIYFLSHFPKQIDVSTSSIEMPKSLFVLLKYVLIPLEFLYFIILYAYTGKITIQGSWPEGWISKLILGFSILGILGFLLSFPKHKPTEQEGEKSKTLSFFGKYYFWMLLPMCVVLLLAIQRRVSEYGVTEFRFFAAALAIWLLVVTFYMVISKKKNIVFIPLSLALFTILSIMGPLNSYNVSLKNQLNRMQTSLNSANMIDNGIIQPASTILSEIDAERINTAIDYLRESNQLDYINNILPEQFKKFTNNNRYSAVYSDFIEYLNLPNTAINAAQRKQHYSVHANTFQAISVQEYNTIQQFFLVNETDKRVNPNNKDAFYRIYIDSEKEKIIIRDKKDKVVTQQSAKNIINKMEQNYWVSNNGDIHRDDLSIEWTDKKISYKLYFDYLSFSTFQDKYINGEGWILSTATIDSGLE